MGIIEESSEKFISDPTLPKLVVPSVYIERILEHNNSRDVIFTENGDTIEIKDKENVVKEVSDMGNDSFDTLFQELKTDMREREQRTREEINKREELFEKQLSSFTQATEKREDRIYALVEGIKNDFNQSEQRITSNIVASEQRIQETESRINQNMADMKADFTDIKQEVTKQVEHLNNMERQNFWGFFAVTATIFIGMLAIVITLIITQL
ncbi:hypothetical protein [Lysinibacillus sp. NPDC056232]|uniref:hypothetical protein n=1 Tax=Lysinibacillus sp. NPDC056232 TaxID=3345756 RepID=UPI0035DC2DDD